jgi:hypothetical protein
MVRVDAWHLAFRILWKHIGGDTEFGGMRGLYPRMVMDNVT